jgi:protein-tyrosine-phosphatase
LTVRFIQPEQVEVAEHTGISRGAGNVKTQPVLFLASCLQSPSEVPDPYYGGEGGFEAVLAMIENACDQLILDIRSKI